MTLIFHFFCLLFFSSQLDFRKTILDRMVHMLSCSYVHPVLEYIKKRWERQDTDISLIRHFVFEVNWEKNQCRNSNRKKKTFENLQVLEMIGPPYDPSFVQLFLPLLKDESIAGKNSLRTEEERKCIREFIGEKDKSLFTTNSSKNISVFRSCVDNHRVEYVEIFFSFLVFCPVLLDLYRIVVFSSSSSSHWKIKSFASFRRF